MTETKCGKCREFICDCVCPDVTGYSRKRRWLREHRKTMRVMQGLIEYRELGEVYQRALTFYPAADIWADEIPDAELDESSQSELRRLRVSIPFSNGKGEGVIISAIDPLVLSSWWIETRGS